jgi:hypothetical protein
LHNNQTEKSDNSHHSNHPLIPRPNDLLQKTFIPFVVCCSRLKRHRFHCGVHAGAVLTVVQEQEHNIASTSAKGGILLLLYHPKPQTLSLLFPQLPSTATHMFSFVCCCVVLVPIAITKTTFVFCYHLLIVKMEKRKNRTSIKINSFLSLVLYEAFDEDKSNHLIQFFLPTPLSPTQPH